MSPWWVTVPLAAAVVGTALTIIAWRCLVARRRRWAATWDGYADERASEAPWPP